MHGRLVLLFNRSRPHNRLTSPQAFRSPAPLYLSLAKLGRRPLQEPEGDLNLISETLPALGHLFGCPSLAYLERTIRRGHLETACALIKTIVSRRHPPSKLCSFLSELVGRMLDNLVQAGERSSTSCLAFALLDDLVRTALAWIDITAHRPGGIHLEFIHPYAGSGANQRDSPQSASPRLARSAASSSKSTSNPPFASAAPPLCFLPPHPSLD